MLLQIVTYPDKRLKTKSTEVEDFDDELHTLLDNMYETMLENNGVGLAAIQVGVSKKILLINIPDENGEQNRDELYEIINPSIKESSGITQHQEGCLSVPEFYEDIERFENITLKYQDRYGEKLQIEATEMLSIALQHEIDHLNGKLFIDKLPYGKRKKFEKEYKKLLKQKKS